MYVDVEDVSKIERVELDYVSRMDDDEDFSEWVNRSKDYYGSDTPPNAVINMIKARLGIN